MPGSTTTVVDGTEPHNVLRSLIQIISSVAQRLVEEQIATVIDDRGILSEMVARLIVISKTSIAMLSNQEGLVVTTGRKLSPV